MSPYERALATARAAEPPALDDARLDAMIRTALVARRVPAEAPAIPARRVPWGPLALAVAAALGLLVLARPDAEPARPKAAAPREHAAPSPSLVELADGDRLTTTAGTEYTLEGSTTDRLVDVRGGALLVDARARGEDEALRVRTPFGEVRVVGTVFSVRVDDDRTVVRVFEGRVVVQSESQAVILGAGGTVSLSVDGFARAPAPSAEERALEAAATAAVERRADAPAAPSVQVVEAPVEVVEPAVVEDDLAAPTPAAPPRAGRVPRPAFARLWIADGQPGRALTAARRAIDEGQHEATWRMVEADALRAMGDPGAAVVAYERAASLYGPALAARAALAAAELRLDALDDPRGATRVLDRWGASAEPLVAARIDALRERIRAE